MVSKNVTDVMSLFNNLTTGIVNLAENLAGGIINIGQNLTTTGNGANINIGTGPKSTITIGNLTNNSASPYNGCCTIAKLKLGYGTAFRGMIMGTIGLNTGGSVSYTIPGAPTGFGNPLIFTTINANMTGNIYVVMTNPTSANTFQYWKRYLSGTTTSDAGNESFNYMAVWL